MTFAGVLAASSYARAQEAEAPAAEPPVDEALQFEVRFAEALVDNALPDYAQTVITAAKTKWTGPEADTQFFAIEIRAMLSLGDFAGAQKKIEALPDRKSPKFWAAKLEVANNLFAQGTKDGKKECTDIYNEFFKAFPKPPPELKSFFMQASYAYGQLLLSDKKFAEAAERYEALLKLVNKAASEEDANTWCNMACETVEIYLRLASEIPNEKMKDRAKYLDPARKLIDQLLWEQDRPVYFGRAIAFLAHTELLKGDIAKAQSTIDDYMDQLAELHTQIKEFDPDGRYGLLRQSPMPQCRYMLADMLWNEAQAEAKKPGKDDEKVKSLMFGAKVGGKRNGQGAYNHALNVFIQYPESAWAMKAGDMEKAIAEFAQKTYGANIKTKVTPEQMEKVRAMQFKTAHEKVAEGDYEGAIADFYVALAAYPEGKLSVQAIEAVINAYGQLLMRRKGDAKAGDWRMELDAVEGYLSERFAGAAETDVMSLAGDATLRAAAAEKQRGEATRADTLQKAFYTNYLRHPNAPNMAAAAANEAQKDEKWADAIALWVLFGECYKGNVFYPMSLSSLAYCYEKSGDRANAIETFKKFLEVAENPLRKAQTQLNLAQLYARDGFDTIAAAETNEVAEVASKLTLDGSMQIVRGIKQFQDLAKSADERLADPGVTASDKEKYSELKEGALFLAGDCWRRLKKPVGKFTLEVYRQRAAENYENYVSQFPKGKYAIKTYVQLGTLYTALGDLEKSRGALDRLTSQFPDSDEAKKSKPSLAKSLIEMGMMREASEIYAEMIRMTGGDYKAWDFVRAGETLLDARNWDLANQAFEKAIAVAGTNAWGAVARARIGQASSLYRQKNYNEARDAIDAILENEKLKKLSAAADANFLLVDVASAQGLTEKNKKLRNSHFGAAMKALKTLRDGYWAKKPQEEKDKLTLMSAEIRIRRMGAEEQMGEKDAALETGAGAAASIQALLQSRMPTETKPLDKMNAAELANLERGYAMLVPLLTKLGGEKLAFVLKFGQEYLDMFPNGSSRTEIQNCINQARAAGAVLTDETAAAADAAAQAGAAEDAAQAAETVTVDETADAEAEPTTSEGE